MKPDLRGRVAALLLALTAMVAPVTTPAAAQVAQPTAVMPDAQFPGDDVADLGADASAAPAGDRMSVSALGRRLLTPDLLGGSIDVADRLPHQPRARQPLGGLHHRVHASLNDAARPRAQSLTHLASLPVDAQASQLN